MLFFYSFLCEKKVTFDATYVKVRLAHLLSSMKNSRKIFKNNKEVLMKVIIFGNQELMSS